MTDTVPVALQRQTAKLRGFSVTPIFGKTIRRNYLPQSIGDPFTLWQEYQAED